MPSFMRNMERKTHSLLLIHLIFFVLSAPPCAVTGRNISMVVAISNPQTWEGAQKYCRGYGSELVTITNEREAEQLALYEGWIGLYRKEKEHWKWSRGDEEAGFFMWDEEAPLTGDCVLKQQSCLRWESDECTELHPFLCDTRLILVQERKTWEEALLHCRELQAADSTVSTHPYDLVSLSEESAVLLDKTGLKAVKEVWVGLRFLAGEWLWMNGHPARNLPRCPAELQHCGAMDVDSETGWKMKNCNEKRKFLCSIKWRKL